MEKIKITTEYERLSRAEELSAPDQELLLEARLALQGAYAPYSQFKVGAALRLESGRIVIGSNQENAAYPSGLCAERVAIFAAASQFPGEHIVALAITARSAEFSVDHPIAPCGSCRQALLEYELNQGTPFRVLLQGESGPVIRLEGIRQLLPLYFHEDGLRHEPLR